MDDRNDEDAWIIPLHGAIVPLPATSAGPVPSNSDVVRPEANPADSTSSTLPISDGFQGDLHLLPEEIPSDIGYHPRLRRSA